MRWHFYLIQIEYTAQRNDCQTLSQLKPWFRHCMVCWIHYTTTITPQLKFKEVVLSQPSIMWCKPANQKIWIFTVYESWIIKQTKEKRVHIRREWMKLLVSQESVMLCPWRSQTQKYGIKWVDWGLNYHVTMKWLQLRPALSSVNLLSKNDQYTLGEL